MSPNVLMIGWELPPFYSGGLGIACLGLIQALNKKGAKITFVLPRKMDVKVDGINLIFADVNEKSSMVTSYTSSSEWLKLFSIDPFPPDFIQGAIEYAKKMYKIAKKQNADIIHAHDWMTYPAAIVAKEVLGKPLVVHVHSTEYDRTGGHNPNPQVYAIEKEGLNCADVVIPVGGYMKDILINNYSVPEEKIKVVYNGVDDDFKKDLPPALTSFKELGYKIVLYLGRITLQKGPEYFVWAAKRVSEYDSRVIFVVTGSGDMQDYMISEAARLGILDKFLFTGFLRGDDRDRIFQAADLYVMPSVSEPFGLVALEAIIRGTPVLVSKQSGVAEILKNALKVDFWDTEEMANKILAVLRYHALPSDLIKEGSKEIGQFSWSNSADKVMGIYNLLI
ncbi:MAG: Glycosyl transferase, group 1 family [Microgenomates group bacterium GW2011_GWC1_37_8]|uniref:4-alpha-glucanotransferase n=2 Tax=Candidatus Woeseibacteriota TaxID=1752722 RepID=A0A0G0NK68_9BACT|nr:MAG: Glycosyl transferase, group 1 family [Microgenomates group bacterium GW2011_GWC1_37_8]KKQ86289.1 MAG: 4-alpha-glucanotransferase [Candidatus Woesebacteria bacterium GW2011_GWB1_38_8]OGM22317.1 MAG: hypothetical protein A2863_04230 [Candidatus Woesebacteria bacterium RIFCSPHIGHO2_01_FULL_38_9b]